MVNSQAHFKRNYGVFIFTLIQHKFITIGINDLAKNISTTLSRNHYLNSLRDVSQAQNHILSSRDAFQSQEVKKGREKCRVPKKMAQGLYTVTQHNMSSNTKHRNTEKIKVNHPKE